MKNELSWVCGSAAVVVYQSLSSICQPHVRSLAVFSILPLLVDRVLNTQFCSRCSHLRSHTHLTERSPHVQ